MDCKLEAETLVNRIENCDEGIVVIIRFENSENINWVSRSEIKLSGHLYDVVELENKPDGFYVSCIPDEKEDKVSNEISIFNKSNDENGNNAKNNLLVNAEKIIKNFISPLILNKSLLKGKINNSANIYLTYTTPLREIPIPPPKYSAS